MHEDAVPGRDFDVSRPGCHSPDANRDDDEVRAREGFPLISCGDHVELPAAASRQIAGEHVHRGQACPVDVHQPELGTVETRQVHQPPDQAGNEHGAAATDDGYLDGHCPPAC